MNTFKGIEELIGGTPLIELSSTIDLEGAGQLFAKCEHLNPGMSLKDRIASFMINAVRGKLPKNSTIVCASSGNTGCSLAMLCQHYGFKAVIVVSKKCSEEKLRHIIAYGALVIVKDENCYEEYANQLAKEESFFNIDQYNNPNNSQAYYHTLGPEIWNQTKGKVTHFVMTGSTFGCISGTARFLKEKNPNIKVVLADPEKSNISRYYYDGYCKGQTLDLPPCEPYMIEGSGKSRPTALLDFSLIDSVISVSDIDAIDACQKMGEKGLLVGGSSGINVIASKKVMEETLPTDVVVTVLCDSGVKYLSKLYHSKTEND